MDTTGETIVWRDVVDARDYNGVIQGRGVLKSPYIKGSDLDVLKLANLKFPFPDHITFSDSQGNFSVNGVPDTAGDISIGLDGEGVKVASLGSTDLAVKISAAGNSPIQLMFNPAGNDELSTAQVNSYYHATRIYNWLKERGFSLPKVVAYPNDKNNPYGTECNAFFYPWDQSLHFLPSGDFCANAAIDTIIYHEYGHFVDQHFGGEEDRGLGEGWGDVMALLVSRTPVAGDGVWLYSPGGFRSANNNYVYNASNEAHQKAMAWSGFVWDILAPLEARHPGLTETLVLPIVKSSQPDIPTAVREVFVRDDDDGSLANGTPDSDILMAAALKHGVAPHMDGNHEALSMAGSFEGWAIDLNNASNSISIQFFATPWPYLSPQSFAGETVADKPSPDLKGVTGNHRFSWKVPFKYRDGKSYKFFAYGISTDGTRFLLPNSPRLATLNPVFGNVAVNSTPDGARIWFKYEGGEWTDSGVNTNLPSTKVPAGEYQIKLVKEGFPDWMGTKLVTEGGDTIFNANLNGEGDATVTSIPDNARIWYAVNDGDWIETEQVTPFSAKNIPVGTYKVKLVKDGYVDWTETKTLTAGGSIAFDATLIEAGNATITSTPLGARIGFAYNDGPWTETEAVTPLEVKKIAVGTYKIKLVMGGYKDWTETKVLSAGGTITFDATLKPVGAVDVPPATEVKISTLSTTDPTSELNLTWTAPTNNAGVTGYSLDLALDPDFNSMVKQYTDLRVGKVTGRHFWNLLPDTTYYAPVRTLDGDGNMSDPSETVSTMTMSRRPKSPTNVKMVAYSLTAVRLTWSNSCCSNTILGYDLEISPNSEFMMTDPGYKKFLSDYVPAYGDYTVDGLLPGQTYFARVRAYDKDGLTSLYSEPISLTLPVSYPETTDKPTNLRVTYVGSGNISLDWDNFGDPSVYNEYIAEVASDPNFYSWSKVPNIKNLSKQLTMYGNRSIDHLLSDTTYYIRIRKYINLHQDSDNILFNYSNTLAVKTLRSDFGKQSPPGVPLLQPDPSSPWMMKVIVQPANDAKGDLDYDADISQDEFRTSAGGFSTSNSTNKSSYDLNLKGLRPNTRYSMRMRSSKLTYPQFGTREYSAWSPTVEFTTPDVIHVKPPSLLQWSDVTEKSLRLTWGPSMGASGYSVALTTDPDRKIFTASFGATDRNLGNVTSYTFEGLTPQTTYYVWVKAYDNGNKYSDYSDPAIGITASGTK